MTTSFEELLNSSEMLKKGDKVTGTVSKIDEDKVYVDVAGAQYDCVILRNQITRKPFENIEEVLSVGDEIEAQVTGIRVDREKRKEDVPGVIYLSHRILENAEYRKLIELSWKQILEKFENGEYVTATVSAQTKGGLLAEVDGLRAFIPGSYIDIRFRRDLSDFVGKEFTFKIEEVDKSKNKIILNRKAILEEEAARKLAEAFENLKVGDVVEGTVRRLASFGAFVNIGEIDGLLHISEVSHKRFNELSEVVSVGDVIKVAIISLDKEKGKVSLSAKALLPTQWEIARGTIKVGDVLEGIVRNTTDFGAFVEVMEDVEGLVHISQISHERVNNVTDVLKAGDKVNVKVLDVDFENERLSLTIKDLIEKPVAPKEEKESEFDTSYLKDEDTSFSVADKFKEIEL
ncbi:MULTISPECIES: 30S ribosomal protein S1 [Gemella]|uniref:30S ribosomal protein S1 n=1 Tax=Gemella TaxID=1378 RepID=UPI0007683F44|nr:MULTISPECIES: 30S ribosomal protein S1 [Gemella]AME09353.1 30S ribosomal protein S1 [Gemella sp. oral taxon 928]AXI26989.1 30S ribosomal protein S1 [Gemella sp. ND 6198]